MHQSHLYVARLHLVGSFLADATSASTSSIAASFSLPETKSNLHTVKLYASWRCFQRGEFNVRNK